MSKPKAIPKLLSSKLAQLRACKDAREWGNGQDPRLAWHACNRPDWLLWLLAHLGMKSAFRRALAAILEEQALPNAGGARPEVAAVIELLRKRNPSVDELRAARAAASAAAYVAASADAASADAAAYDDQCGIIRGAVPWSSVRVAARRRGLMA